MNSHHLPRYSINCESIKITLEKFPLKNNCTSAISKIYFFNDQFTEYYGLGRQALYFDKEILGPIDITTRY